MPAAREEPTLFSGPPLTSPIDSVVVLRALTGMGDHLCTVPALRALRAGLPRAHIAVLTVPGAEAVLSRFPQYVDELIPFAGFPGIPEKPFAPGDLPGFYQSMIGRRFDVAIQMQGNGLVSNSLVAMLGARITAGYFLPGQYRPDDGWFLEYPHDLPEIGRHLALMEFLGFPGRGEHLEFPVTGDDRVGCEHLRPAGRYVCIHPGAMAAPRRWSPAGFAAVADFLAGSGVTVLFTGQAFEADLVARIRGLMARSAVDLTGTTTVGSLAALLEGAELLVCNDTGVSHLASALGVPSVVVFAGTRYTGSDPLRWAPLDRDLHLVVAREARPRDVASADGHPGPPGSHRRGACCLADGCTAARRPEDGPEPPPVSLAQVLRAVRRQLERRTGGRVGLLQAAAEVSPYLMRASDV